MLVIGAGPSLLATDPTMLRGLPAIACNAAVKWYPQADIWFSAHPEVVAAEAPADFAGTRIGCATKAERPCDWPTINLMREDRCAHRFGVCFAPDGLRLGTNSGHAAINLALHCGASAVVLIGFDMKIDDPARAHFDGSPGPDPNKYRQFHRPAFKMMAEQLSAAGLTVLNATPDSALEAFPRVSLAEALDRVT